MKKLVERLCICLWHLFGKNEHIPCRWCASKVAPLCTEECQAACPSTRKYKSNEHKKQERKIAALTARAEQAEAEAKGLALEVIAMQEDFNTIERDGLCEVCFFGDFSEVSKSACMEDCCFQWRKIQRGLHPQDGEFE